MEARVVRYRTVVGMVTVVLAALLPISFVILTEIRAARSDLSDLRERITRIEEHLDNVDR